MHTVRDLKAPGGPTPIWWSDDEMMEPEGHVDSATSSDAELSRELLEIVQQSLDARTELESRLAFAQALLTETQRERNQAASEALLLMHQAIAQRDEAMGLVWKLRQEIQGLNEQLGQAERRELHTVNFAHSVLHIAQELAHNTVNDERREVLQRRLEALHTKMG